MADTKDSGQSRAVGLSDRPSIREIPPDPTTLPVHPDSSRSVDIRLSDDPAGGAFSELVNLLRANGFALEFEYLAEGRLRLTVERPDETTDPESPRLNSTSPMIEPDLVEMVSAQTMGEPKTTIDQIDPYLCRDVGLFSYTAGLFGAAAFMALAIGPGWLGFVVGFLPASLFASWAVSGHA